MKRHETPSHISLFLFLRRDLIKSRHRQRWKVVTCPDFIQPSSALFFIISPNHCRKMEEKEKNERKHVPLAVV